MHSSETKITQPITFEDQKKLFEKTDPKDDLQKFVAYDATYHEEMIHSIHKDSELLWVRTAQFLKLAFILDSYIDEYAAEISKEQQGSIERFLKFVVNPTFVQRIRTEKSDIEEALLVLEALGIDVSIQRKQLEETWPKII